FLNKLLFQAAPPEKRYLILEHFYTLPALLIERFYQGRLSGKDKIRIFLGKPPVSITHFLKVLITGR
ncbi:MAG: lycopene cyclase family protein, partial [Bacteriovoracaceae bacterium]